MASVPRPSDHTIRFRDLRPDHLDAGSTVIFGAIGSEPRGRLPAWDSLRSTSPDRCVVVTSDSGEGIEVEGAGQVGLRDGPALRALLPAGGTLYLDISGLPHHVWAPLLRAALSTSATVKAIYAEPQRYKPHPSPASPNVFDLSDDFGGLAPLPGFAQLAGPPDDQRTLFVPFLGFEGSRPRHLAMQLDPTPKVVPIVGVPGFRVEYPTFTIACNRLLLDEYQAHAEVRLARASCPFEAVSRLRELRVDYPGHYLYLAPVGTKPHSLGVVMFALENPSDCEILYDHPLRKTGRTRGIGLVHIYTLT